MPASSGDRVEQAEIGVDGSCSSEQHSTERHSPAPVREPIHEDDIRMAANDGVRRRVIYNRSLRHGESTEPEAEEVN